MNINVCAWIIWFFMRWFNRDLYTVFCLVKPFHKAFADLHPDTARETYMCHAANRARVHGRISYWEYISLTHDIHKFLDPHRTANSCFSHHPTWHELQEFWINYQEDLKRK